MYDGKKEDWEDANRRNKRQEQVRPRCREIDRGRCSSEKMEVSGQTEDRITKTEVERRYTKIHKVDKSTERRSTRTENVDNENSMHRPQMRKRPKKMTKDKTTSYLLRADLCISWQSRRMLEPPFDSAANECINSWLYRYVCSPWHTIFCVTMATELEQPHRETKLTSLIYLLKWK